MRKKLLTRIFILSIFIFLSFFLSAPLTVHAEANSDNSENMEVVESQTEDYATKVAEYIIAGILGLVGTSTVAILFRKQLKSLIGKITTALALLNTSKDTTEEEVKKIIKEADSTLASLKNVKEEIMEVNKKEYEEIKKQVMLLKQVLVYMAGGMKELVANGTSECICNLSDEPKKEVKENASEEIQ